MVIKKQVRIRPYGCNRTLHIYLPNQCSKEHPAAVLYMFDGHNLFYDEEATYGKSWGLRKYLDEHNLNLIVVGLECNHEGNERLSEFTPYDFYDEPWGQIFQKGQELAKWMATELKPWIDEQFPTKKDRLHTYIGGSSMGGLMSLYMMLKYSDVYSKAVCISPHNYPMYKSIREDLGSYVHPQSVIYMSWGGQEYPDPYIFAKATDQNLQIIRALMKKEGVDVIPHVFKNDDHSEAAWEKELPIWFEELEINEV